MPISERPEEYGCVILAAGLGRRFGGGKLLAQFDGQPLYRRVMDAVPGEARGRTAVVSGDADILAAAAERVKSFLSEKIIDLRAVGVKTGNVLFFNGL